MSPVPVTWLRFSLALSQCLQVDYFKVEMQVNLVHGEAQVIKKIHKDHAELGLLSVERSFFSAQYLG